jgi:hypothetical protein
MTKTEWPQKTQRGVEVEGLRTESLTHKMMCGKMMTQNHFSSITQRIILPSIILPFCLCSGYKRDWRERRIHRAPGGFVDTGELPILCVEVHSHISHMMDAIPE